MLDEHLLKDTGDKDLSAINSIIIVCQSQAINATAIKRTGIIIKILSVKPALATNTKILILMLKKSKVENAVQR